jgi:hypothetical protein
MARNSKMVVSGKSGESLMEYYTEASKIGKK